MPNGVIKKTASAHKLPWWDYHYVLAFILLAVGIAFLAVQPRQIVTVAIGGHSFYTKVAATDSARQQGLGGTRQLLPNQGMLFVFARDEKWQFWMKDMHYAIDMVWLDSNKQVVAVVSGLSPDSYPRAFTPPLPTRYVLELPSGSAAGFMLGTRATFVVP